MGPFESSSSGFFVWVSLLVGAVFFLLPLAFFVYSTCTGMVSTLNVFYF